MRRIVLAACLAGVVAAAAGCGGGGGGNAPLSKADYEQQMQALQAKLSTTANQLQTAFSDTTNIPAMTKGLRQAADLLDQASTGLADISPPKDVADAHQTMVDKSAAAADKIREFADTIENASLAELQTKLKDFQNIGEFNDLQKAVAEIKSKGYDIGGTSP